ncbi:PIN domain-containing protein [Rhodohalobacter sp. SW132]|uniref:type II toxin-antitoxin system VapC family toxin n=1 Tax=Rhodohalobacter sp. SW132 TaxID=2293433 RepID=UPI000E2324B3|nr:type II toxin-antitoxin system VapC family toxin [Rhodohalobacter sp. SW132]REL38149.1 PIN domain-containing protein [Rhodohalobacter sp. SW132]
MSIPVIDACVAIKWFLPEKDYQKAGEILSSHNRLFAPDLFQVEMDSIITKKVRQKLIETEDAYRIYDEIRKIPIQIIPYSLIGKLAFDLSAALPITQYDACYLASAIEYDEKVISADMRFVRGMKGTPFEHYVDAL